MSDEELGNFLADKDKIAPYPWKKDLFGYGGKFMQDKPEWVPLELMTSCLPTIVRTHEENLTCRPDGTITLIKVGDWTFLVTAAHCVLDDENNLLELFLGFQSKKAAERYFINLKKLDELGGRWILDQSNERVETGLRKVDLAILPVLIEKTFLNKIQQEFLPEIYLPKQGIYVYLFQEGIHLGFGNAMSGQTKKVDLDVAKELGLQDHEIRDAQDKGFNLFLPISSRAQIQDMKPYEENKIIVPIISVGLPGFSGGPLFFNDRGQPKLFGFVIRTGGKSQFDSETGKQRIYITEDTKVIVWSEVVKLLNDTLPNLKEEELPILKSENFLKATVTYISEEEFVITTSKTEFEKFDN
ncbi:MAG: hypothetical protein HeimC2_00300 [Candidatus Heimdallarchaeota archaeon LC_2]|nr:MAG: hypothetical protein HeimC2_00300 [Candidatus Heimdallarchaeota archaeon LC_2]